MDTLVVFQNPPVIPCEDRYLDPLKAEPQEMFVGPNTYSLGIWKTRVVKNTSIYIIYIYPSTKIQIYQIFFKITPLFFLINSMSMEVFNIYNEGAVSRYLTSDPVQKSRRA